MLEDGSSSRGGSTDTTWSIVILGWIILELSKIQKRNRSFIGGCSIDVVKRSPMVVLVKRRSWNIRPFMNHGHSRFSWLVSFCITVSDFVANDVGVLSLTKRKSIRLLACVS